MLSLSAISKAEKNKLATDSAFIMLLKIKPPSKYGLSDINICYNNEDVTYKSELYQAFPIQLGDVTEDSTGSEPSIELKVANTSQALQAVVEQSDGGNGSDVEVMVVNTKAVAANGSCDPELDEHYTCTHASCTQDWVTFNLGPGYNLRSRRPAYRYMKNNCPFHYKGLRCGCTSSASTCGHTLVDCRARGNSARFGGFPGIDQKGVYLND